MISIIEEDGWNQGNNIDSELNGARHQHILKAAGTIIQGLNFTAEELKHSAKQALHDLKVAYNTTGSVFYLKKGIHQRIGNPHLTFRVQGLAPTFHLLVAPYGFRDLGDRFEWRGIQFTTETFMGVEAYPQLSSSASPPAGGSASGAVPAAAASAYVASSGAASPAAASSVAPSSALAAVATGTILPSARARGKSFSGDMYAAVYAEKRLEEQEHAARQRLMDINAFKQRTVTTIINDYKLQKNQLAGFPKTKQEVQIPIKQQNKTLKITWNAGQLEFTCSFGGTDKVYRFT